MKHKSPTRIVREVSRLKFARNWIVRYFLKKISHKVLQRNYPVLACVPHDVVGREITASGLFEEDILKALFDNVLSGFLLDFRNSVALDIGANIGNHTCFFSRYFDHVISFEPNPGVAKILHANLLLNDIKNVTLEEIGLSNQKKELPFHQNKSGNIGGSRFITGNSAEFPETRYLRVDIGDSVLDRASLKKRISLIKIDVEGHEYPALKGLHRTIIASRPIILFETHTSEGEWGGKAIFDYLRSLGYDYFYSIDKPQSEVPGGSHSLMSTIYNRLRLGCDYSLEEIDILQNRLYYLIIATSQPLQ